MCFVCYNDCTYATFRLVAVLIMSCCETECVSNVSELPIGLYYENIWFVICNDLNRLEINLMLLADNGHDIKIIIGNSRLLTISTTSNGTPTDGITSAFEMY